MSAGENGREDLFDDGILTHDDFMQFFDHEIPASLELRQEILKTRLLFSGQDGLSQVR